MKKKDILGLIRSELTRSQKPKKSLDEYMVGDEDKHEEIMRSKRSPDGPPKKRNTMDERIGVAHGEAIVSKPKVEVLDFGALNRMAPKDQIKNLKREYINLLDKLDEMSSNLLDEKSGKSDKSIQLEKFKRELSVFRTFIREVVDFIPDAYDLKIQMDTTVWEVKDVNSDIITKMKSLVNKVKFAEQAVAEEMKQITAHKKLLEDELYRVKEENAHLKLTITNGTVGVAQNPSISPSEGELKEGHESLPVENLTGTGNETQKINPFDQTKAPEVAPKVEVSPVEVRPSTGNAGFTIPEIPDDVPKYVFLDVDRYIENLPDASKYVLEIIGSTGISRNSELKIEVENSEEGQKFFFSNGKFVYNELNNAVKMLKDRQFLDSQNVKLGSKGGYDFSVYELSDIGKAVYYKFKNLQPVEPEMAQILRDHKTLEHGYLIKEVATEFRAMGMKVFEDRETCTYDVGNGKRKVFDLIVEENGEKKHIEVERGTHNEEDFFNMMDKIFHVTKDIYFIAPNEKVLYSHTKGKVFKWITDRLGGFDAAKGVLKMHFTTFEKVKKHSTKLWEDFEL